jgi:alkylhydroperoxidase family enzyme
MMGLAWNGVHAFCAMTYSLDQIDWCEVPLISPMTDPVWEKESTKRNGPCTYVAQYISPVRWMLHADELMHARVTPHVPLDLAMLISLVVAMDSSCRHCYGAFRSMLKIMGYSEKVIREIEESLTVDELSDRDKIALDFARKVSRSDPRPSDIDVAQLEKAGYSTLEIAEIVYLAANNSAANRLATLLALPPDPVEKLEVNWIERLKRPFTRKSFRESASTVWNGDPRPDYTGPGARVVQELDGSPAAVALASTLSEAWASDITSQRVKALILAVISRGLECPACENEAGRILQEEGWTEDEIEFLLTHLVSDKLDPFELKALRFARETVRYDTRRLQDMARGFAEGLDREKLVEVIGLVSYFNGLARMSILLGHC